MIHLLRSEIRKLLTIRSTYGLILACLAITVFFAFYIMGYRTTAPVTDPGALVRQMTDAIQFLVLFFAIIGVLLMTHEYRFGTIMYTLTSSPRRWQVLVAKIVTVTVLVLLLTAVFAALAPLLTYAGWLLKGVNFVPQDLPSLDLVARVLFYSWAYAMFALLIAVLVRNQNGAIAVLFLLPLTIEILLGLLLRERAAYLPFTLLQSVVQNQPASMLAPSSPLSPWQAAGVFTIYLIVGWLIGLLLFLKRDAA
ncbi:MAG TPA: hypothetical protein VK983_02230 [Candidatus Limnocylindrales bacterium]|nr:hypothetical protein [Candidatus Limnocylindrales bacterium]